MPKNKSHGLRLGEKLYSLRMAEKMTQEQLALALHISPAAISKWERLAAQRKLFKTGSFCLSSH